MVYATKQQQAVLHCLEQRSDEALTATDLAAQLRQAGQPVGLATIYRQLEKLAASGRIHRVHTEAGALFQYCPHPETERPCFLLRCEACGRIVHLDCAHLEELTRHLAATHRFQVDLRRTTLTGRCEACALQEVSHGTQ